MSPPSNAKPSQSAAPSYHDLHITTALMPRTSIFNLPFNTEVTCTRCGGWQLWDHSFKPAKQVASEYAVKERGLILDIAGHVIVDSLTTSITN